MGHLRFSVADIVSKWGLFCPTRSSLGRSLNGPKVAGASSSLCFGVGSTWIIPGRTLQWLKNAMVSQDTTPKLAELYGKKIGVLGCCSFRLRPPAGCWGTPSRWRRQKSKVLVDEMHQKRLRLHKNFPVIFGVGIFHPPISFSKKKTPGCC